MREAKCDCIIMVLHGFSSNTNYIARSKVVEELTTTAATSNRYFKIVNNKAVDDKPCKPAWYLDKRRGLSTMFNYCPYCGIKVNWKEIKKELQDDKFVL